MSITINAPSDFTGASSFGPTTLTFKDGKAVYDGDELPDGLHQYLVAAGYGIGEHAAPELPAEPVHVDPRDIDVVQVGSDLRDAAVDPQPEDYLPPVNAGHANPHGPEVVAPGIHAVSGAGPIHPGPVGKTGDDGQVVKDTDTQAANETALAKAVFVDGTPVPEATKAAALVDPINEDASPADGDGLFDPANHTVPEVNEHLANADEAERQRVLDAEAAGKNRATVTAPAPAGQ